MRVRIFKPSVSATQSFCGCKGRRWQIEMAFESPRVREPFMGWVAARDPFSSMLGRLRFDTAEDAQRFAHQQGWDSVIDSPNERFVDPRSYMENFNPDRRRDGR